MRAKLVSKPPPKLVQLNRFVNRFRPFTCKPVQAKSVYEPVQSARVNGAFGCQFYNTVVFKNTAPIQTLNKLLYYLISFTLMKAEVLPPKCPISFLKNLYFEGRVRFNDTTYLLPNITQPLHFRVQCDKYPLQQIILCTYHPFLLVSNSHLLLSVGQQNL